MRTSGCPHVEFVDGLGVVVDLGERQFLAQFVALTAVAGEVDRLQIEERFVQPVELLLDRLDGPLLLRGPVVRFRAPLLPDVEDAVLHQAHVAGCRLQEREFVGERAFEHSFADVHRTTLALAVVVRVAVVSALRPAPRQRTAADLAAYEATQRKVRVIPLSRTGNHHAAVEP